MKLYVYLVCGVVLTAHAAVPDEDDLVEQFKKYCSFSRYSRSEPFSLCDPWHETTLLTSNAFRDDVEKFIKRLKQVSYGVIQYGGRVHFEKFVTLVKYAKKRKGSKPRPRFANLCSDKDHGSYDINFLVGKLEVEKYDVVNLHTLQRAVDQSCRERVATGQKSVRVLVLREC